MLQTLPDMFCQRTKSLLNDSWSDFLRSLELPPLVSIRLNQRKLCDPSAIEVLPTDATPVPWCNKAYYLPIRPSFTLDPLLHAGGYYVQEAASMFLEQCVQEASRHRQLRMVLDLCAAPGGKSTHLAGLLTYNSLLVSNEVIRSRASILCENITKWGFPNTVVTNNDPKDFERLPDMFDLIWVDAPCSGEGMFRKEPKAIQEWSMSKVELCAARQRRILADCWDSLQAGGFLAYSTCTYNEEENEGIVKWLMQTKGAEPVPVKVPDNWGIHPSFDTTVHGARFFPHLAQGEGFFACLLRKPITGEQVAMRRKSKLVTHSTHPVGNWLNQQVQEWHFEQHASSAVFAHPLQFASDIYEIRQRMSVLLSGLKLADIKGKDQIPTAGLALSSALDTSGFECWDTDKALALRYLRKESLTDIPQSLPKGHVLLTYKQTPLGWVKNLGSRCNNLYPAEWRIRM